MSTPNPTIYCFPDTNTLIHFQTFDQVNWPAVLGAEEVELVLAPSVLEELDKHKNDVANSKRSKRARMLNSKLKDLLESAPALGPVSIRKGVTLSDIVHAPQVDWHAWRLDSTSMDDRFVATVLEFREEFPDKEVVVVSNDFGVRRKAVSFNLTAKDPEDSITKYQFPTEEEQTIRQLTQELMSLRNRLPQLRFGFATGDGFSQRIILPRPKPTSIWLSDEDIEGRLQEEKDDCLSELTGSMWRWKRDECEEFMAAVDRYIDNLRLYLRQERLVDAGYRMELQFVIENAGSAPATDIRTSVLFPETARTVLLSDEHHEIRGSRSMDQPKAPEPPDEPEFDQLSSSLASSLAGISTLANIFPQPPLFHMPSIDIPSGFGREPEGAWASDDGVTLRQAKLRAKEKYYSEWVVAIMPPLETDGLKITYVLHADELSEPVHNALHVVFSD